MFELFGAVLSGGATGIIGSLVGRVFGWLEKREEAKENAAQRAHELDLQKLNIQARAAETENELAILDAESRRDQLLASFQHDRSDNTSTWVNNVKAMVRPTLTFALIVLTAILYFSLNDNAEPVEVVKIKAYIVNTIVYTTSAAVLWWFGDRGQAMKK